MTINGGSEFMTYGGYDNDDEYAGGGFMPTMEDIRNSLTTNNVITAIVLVVIIIFLYNYMINSNGKVDYYGNTINSNPSNRINRLENSEYVYGNGTRSVNTDPESQYYTFLRA